MNTGKLKLAVLLLAVLFGITASIFDRVKVVERAAASSDEPSLAHSGAPGESTCTACHENIAGDGTITVTAPARYRPGQTYLITVQHYSTDTTRLRWGFQLTAIANNLGAGNFASLNGNTAISQGQLDRVYVGQTSAGSFPGQANSATWTFNWIAPATNVGPVTFYAAGYQANNNNNPNGDRILTTNVVAAAPQSPYDFDGDNKTDIGITRQNAGNLEWWLNRSTTNNVFATVFGISSDIPAPGDFTGDGKADIAVFRPSNGNWIILRSEDFSFLAFPFGANGDIPMPADYDNDQRTDAAVFRPSQGLWFINQTGGGGVLISQFGTAGDQPVASDYDGDGRADIGIARNNGSNKEWWIQRSAAGFLSTVFGTTTDKTVPGDYTGDGKSDIAVFRQSNGTWLILRSEDFSFLAFPWGQAGDIPSPGDYDGDGKYDSAVFRPSVATWFINRTGGSGPLISAFGSPTDTPVPSVFVR